MKLIISLACLVLTINAYNIPSFVSKKQLEHLSELAFMLKISDYCNKTIKAREFLKRENFKFIKLHIKAGLREFKGNAHELNIMCEKYGI